MNSLPTLDLVLDRISDSFSVLDKEWRLVFANTVALQTLGRLDKANIIGKNIWEEFPELVGTELYTHYVNAMERQQPGVFELYFEPLDIYSSISIYPFEGGIAVFSQDVTAQRKAEKAMREEAERVRLATEAAGLGLWDYDPQTGVLNWDLRTREIFGISPDADPNFEVYMNLIHAEDRFKLEAAISEAMDPERRSQLLVEHRIVLPSGELRYVMSRGKAIFDESDQSLPTRLIGTVGDLTNIRRMSEELDAQREWLRITMNSIGDAVITTDTSGNVTYLNPVAEKMTGWEMGLAVNQPLTEVFKIMNEVTHEVQENPVDKVLEHGITVGLANHTILISRDGEETPIEDSAAPIRNAENEVIGVVLVFHDASESRKSEELLKRHNRKISRILEGIGEGFCSFDREWNITFANEKAQDILRSLKREKKDFIGTNVWSEFPDLIWTEIYERYHESIRTQQPTEFEINMPDLDGLFKVRAFPSLEGLSVFFQAAVAK